MGENKRVKRLHVRLSERDAYMLEYVSIHMNMSESEIFRRSLRNVYSAEKYGYTDYVPEVETPAFKDHRKKDFNVRIYEEELNMVQDICEKTGKTYSDVFRDGLTMLYSLVLYTQNDDKM